MQVNWSPCSIWWASEGPTAPQTPQGISLTASRCRRSLALSRLFIVLFDPLLLFANLIAAAMRLPRVILNQTKLPLNLHSQVLAHDFARLAHDNPLPAIFAMKVKDSAIIFTIVALHQFAFRSIALLEPPSTVRERYNALQPMDFQHLSSCQESPAIFRIRLESVF